MTTPHDSFTDIEIDSSQLYEDYRALNAFLGRVGAIEAYFTFRLSVAGAELPHRVSTHGGDGGQTQENRSTKNSTLHIRIWYCDALRMTAPATSIILHHDSPTPRRLPERPLYLPPLPLPHILFENSFSLSLQNALGEPERRLLWTARQTALIPYYPSLAS
ncbi:hypothetical protein DL93DRAFT_2232498 [Clavulina sp. PMI_390]|nr:hypothetical protein DL93DRAFT_2232498 [Clavulina sp. PMI_390]